MPLIGPEGADEKNKIRKTHETAPLKGQSWEIIKIIWRYNTRESQECYSVGLYK